MNDQYRFHHHHHCELDRYIEKSEMLAFMLVLKYPGETELVNLPLLSSFSLYHSLSFFISLFFYITLSHTHTFSRAIALLSALSRSFIRLIILIPLNVFLSFLRSSLSLQSFHNTNTHFLYTHSFYFFSSFTQCRTSLTLSLSSLQKKRVQAQH